MKFSRKNFIKTGLLLTAGLGLNKFPKIVKANNTKNQLASINKKTDSFWAEIRKQFCTSSPIINLNNGALSPQPLMVQDAFVQSNQYSNEGPSYFMWKKLEADRESVRNELAKLAGCTTDALAFTRNATEALNTIIHGIPLKANDEIVLSSLDYPFVINSWKQRAEREDLMLKFVELNCPETEDLIIQKFKAAINSKTKVVQITHMINWNGQILPVNKIAKIARKYGAKVVLDAAHSFAHLPYKISELDIDYYATSLHKWLCGPFGTGFLHIKNNLISETWPLHSAYDSKSDDIKKFEFIGSRNFAAEIALKKAIELHHIITPKLKYERLSYLKNYWIDKVINLSGFKLISPRYNNEGGSIAAFSIEGFSGQAIADFLFNNYKLHTGVVHLVNMEAVRISPHIYTTESELDILVKGIKQLAK